MSFSRYWPDRGPRARQFLSFLVVGAVATGAYAAACATLAHWLPAWKTTIMIAVYAALIPVVFFAQRRLTFQSSGSIWREFLAYGSMQLASVAVSALLLAGLLTDDPLRNLAVYLMVAVLAAILSFVVCHGFIFSTPVKRRAAPPEAARNFGEEPQNRR